MPSVSIQKKKTDTISFAIRAERNLYETFRDQTHRDGLNPSVVIRQFIRSYNDGNMSVGLRELEFDRLFEDENVRHSLTRLSSALDTALGSS